MEPLSIASDAIAAEKALSFLISTSSKASKTLLKHPDLNSHSSWHLWLPPHFNSALDIRYTWRQQVKDKKVIRKWKEWGQGSNFCFNEGSIIYDRDVSDIRTWGEKLDAISFYIVVGETRPVSWRSSPDLLAIEESKFSQVDRSPGTVKFKIYVPSPGHGSELSIEHTVTQDQFVHYAISGSL